ncbi:hypothetical protein [Azospirillum sp. B4]|nr:hypothetical protein [Azospirillum sp. B4]
MTPAGTPRAHLPIPLPPCLLRDGWWLVAAPRPGVTAVILPFKPKKTPAP